jgi:hypothetical protein
MKKKNGSERDNAGIIRKVNRLDKWLIHPFDGFRSQHNRYLENHREMNVICQLCVQIRT